MSNCYDFIGTELKNTEVLVILAHAHLTIEHRPFGIEFDPNGKNDK